MIIEALYPLHIRRASGDLHLRPGYPEILPDEEAVKLLAKVPDKIRASPATIEPAVNPDGHPLAAIYWEAGDGSILGPAIPEFPMRDGEDFWIGTTFEEQVRWINAEQLRSQKAFEKQVPVHEAEPIREDHR